MVHRRRVAFTAALGLWIGLGVGVVVAPNILRTSASEKSPIQVSESPVSELLQTPNVSSDLLEQSFGVIRHWKAKEGTRILILPHHLVAAREIASLISATKAPSVVYLIAPDHFTQGTSAFTATDKDFSTVAGDVSGSSKKVRQLLDGVTGMRLDDHPFEKEHGISNIVPFIASAWPRVSVVPVIVRLDASISDREALAKALTEQLTADPNALIIASIDFSHYLPAEVADFHDELALDVIRSLSDREADRVEIDSPGALGVALNVARNLELGDVTIHDHTNSLRLLHATIAQESTSHVLASFAPGPIIKQRVVNLLFLGDMMFDRHVADRVSRSKDSEYTFEKIRGQEDRFFNGQDAVIANLEGPVTPVRRPPEKSIDFAFDPIILKTLRDIGIDAVSQANNHTLDQGRQGAEESKRLLHEAGIVSFGDEVMDDEASSLAVIESRGQKVALLGFNTTDNPFDRDAASAAIESAKRQAGHTVVFMHWGQEYKAKPDTAQVELAHWFIDQGVDAVIGSHPHWVQSVEEYRGHPIAYSLGNFIFDQDWSEETNLGLVVGLELSDKGSEMHLFPIKIVASQPQLLTGDERKERLENLADISNPELSTQIRAGIIHLLY